MKKKFFRFKSYFLITIIIFPFYFNNLNSQCLIPPSYNFTITPTASWQTTSNSISSGGCHVYRVYMTTTNGYDFTVCGNDGVGATTNNDGDLTLYNSSGVQQWYIDGASSCGYDASTIGTIYEAWSPPSDGYYYLVVEDYVSSAITYTLAYRVSGSDPCSSVISITGCGSSNSQSFTGGGSGSWSTSFCGYSTPGLEQIYSFVAPTTGIYSIQVTVASGWVDYAWQASSCGSGGWTCIGDINSTGTYGSMSWTAGTTYYILLDDEDGTTGTHTFYIDCPVVGPVISDNCSWAQDLSLLTSPYSSTTVGYADDISACRTGSPDRVFYIDVPDCYRVNIWESTNSYDEYEYCAWGGACPGANTINCWDNDALATNMWDNTTGSTQTVWYVQDAYSGSGTFTLNWSLNTISIPAPTTSTHTSSTDQIIWNWNTVSGATGYKWNTTNNYSTAIDVGASTSYTETGLTCNTSYTTYVWAYFSCGNSTPTTLNANTLTCPLPGDNCTNAMDLTSLSNPYSSSTIGYLNDVSTCRTGYPDRVFYIEVGNGCDIDIWESTNNYDEYEYMGYGSSCPGIQINCWDNDALAHNTWTNSTGSTQTVWYVQDAYSGSGNFTLEWTINCPCGVPAGTASASPTSVTACDNTTLTLVGYGGTIQWQSSSNGTTWNDIPGATSTPYVATVGGTAYYRAAVTSGCTSYSNSVTVTVGGVGNNYYVNDGSISGDIYCSAIGNGGNSGTAPCSPKATIQDIIDSYDLNAGDTIFIDAGTYTMGCDIGSSDEGSSVNDVVIIGAGASATIINAPAADNNFHLVDVQYVRIENMRLNSSQASNYNYIIEEGTQNHLENCYLLHTTNTNIYLVSHGGALDIDQNSFANCTIENSSSSGYNIWFDGDADNDTIRDCTITSTGTGGAKAIYLTDRYEGLSDMWPTTIRMYNNIITSDDYGFYANTILGNSMEAFDIHDNTFIITSKDRADGAALWLQDHGIVSSDISNIYRNRISGGKDGIYLTNGVDYCHFYNNYIYGSDIGINVNDDLSDDNDLTHNSFYTAQQCAYFNLDSKAYWNVRNNIFYSYGNSSYECLYAGDFSSTFVTCDYNIYYAPNGANIAEYVGAKALYSTLAAWQGVNHHDAAGNGDVNSFYTDPNYQAPVSGSLDLTGNYQTGISVGTVTSDIYSTARTHPTIGAWEEGSVLPVELISFSANCIENSILVYWSTASEINNDYFEIEKTYDFKDWLILGAVYGAGNSNQVIDYTFYDNDIMFNLSTYYRIKQIDYDNNQRYSPIFSVFCEEIIEDDDIIILTKPEEFELIFKDITEGEYNVFLFDYSGRLVYSNLEQIDYSDNKIIIPKRNLSSGLYSIVLQSESSITTKQVIVPRN